MLWKRYIPEVNELLMKSYYKDGSLPVKTDIPDIAASLCVILDRELPDYMADYGEALHLIAEETDPAFPVIENFDEELNELYDYGDTYRIWFGVGIE
jgi:hypothetical protein